MPQVIPDIPFNTIAAVKEFIQTHNAKEMGKPSFNTTTFTNPLHETGQFLPNYRFSFKSDWENFKSELEFE